MCVNEESRVTSPFAACGPDESRVALTYAACMTEESRVASTFVEYVFHNFLHCYLALAEDDAWMLLSFEFHVVFELHRVRQRTSATPSFAFRSHLLTPLPLEG